MATSSGQHFQRVLLLMPWEEPPQKRSIHCNGEMVRFHRNRLGLTQSELADLSGFTTRLIAKAEAGGSLKPHSLDVLAEALSSEDRPVFPEDLICSPKVIVRKIIEAYAKHEANCIDHCKQFLAEDVRIRIPGDPLVIQFAGEYHSISGVEQFWKTFFCSMERHNKKLISDSMRLFADGNLIAVLTYESFSCATSKSAATITPLGLIFEFERGKVKSLENHFDINANHNSI